MFTGSCKLHVFVLFKILAVFLIISRKLNEMFLFVRTIKTIVEAVLIKICLFESKNRFLK